MAHRVLFINEFGSGLTHFNALLGAFYRMKSAGVELDARFYLRPDEDARKTGFSAAPIHAAPGNSLAPRRNDHFKNRTYGELIHGSIILKKEDPAAWFKAWDAILTEFDPHLVVMDYAPVAQLVAQGRWPTLVIGYGYTMPPANTPRFVTFGRDEPPRQREDNAKVDDINRAMTGTGARKLEKLTDLCRVDRQVNATVPPFDPYIDLRDPDSYVGLYHPGGSPWPKPGTAMGALAYFHAFSQDDDGLIRGLKSAGIVIDCYAGAPKPSFKEAFANSTVKVHDKPLPLKDMLPGRAVMIHMGGQGVSLAALFAGVPQLLFHTHAENAFNARMISLQGAGFAQSLKDLTSKRLPELINDVANDPVMRQKAFEMGRQLAKYRDADPIGALAKVALEMLGVR